MKNLFYILELISYIVACFVIGAVMIATMIPHIMYCACKKLIEEIHDRVDDIKPE